MVIRFKNGKEIVPPAVIGTVVTAVADKAIDMKGYAIAAGTGLAAGLATAKVKFRKEKGFSEEYENDYRNIGLLTDAEAQQ